MCKCVRERRSGMRADEGIERRYGGLGYLWVLLLSQANMQAKLHVRALVKAPCHSDVLVVQVEGREGRKR